MLRDTRLLAQNDDWGTPLNQAAAAAEIAAAAENSGAFSFSAGSKDAALLLTLAPGLYTAQISGVAGATGVALIEVYEVTR